MLRFFLNIGSKALGLSSFSHAIANANCSEPSTLHERSPPWAGGSADELYSDPCGLAVNPVLPQLTGLQWPFSRGAIFEGEAADQTARWGLGLSTAGAR